MAPAREGHLGVENSHKLCVLTSVGFASRGSIFSVLVARVYVELLIL